MLLCQVALYTSVAFHEVVCKQYPLLSQLAASSQVSHHSSAAEEEEEEDEAMVLLPCLPPIRTSLPNLAEALEQGKTGVVKYVLHWFLFIMAFPYLVAYTWTIPNCTKNRKWYVVTAAFLMAILWIAVISFGMVTLVARVGCILDVGEFTMGLVVVAVGTSIPVSKTLSH